MSILTKEERENWRSVDALGVAMMPEEVVGFILRALDTIDALEAERDQARELADFLEKNDARKPRAGTRIKSNL